METTPQTNTPTTFDTAALAEQLATTITAQINEAFNAAGILDRGGVRACVDTHLKHTLRSLADEGLMMALEEVQERMAAARTRDEQLLADPRYADAPKVTMQLRLQQWTGPKEDQLQEVGWPEEVVIPAAWLARQDREQLEKAADEHTDRDWIAHDLSLLGDHDGPFELDLMGDGESVRNYLEQWLEATAQ